LVTILDGLFYAHLPVSRGTPRVFYTFFYNHAHRLRLEKLLYLGLSRSPNGFLKPLLDPGGGFTSETAVRRYVIARSDVTNGCVTAVAAGQSQRFYS
jgi:hypothetical protein